MSQMLSFDPRFENLHAGWELLYRIHPDRNRAFTLDWKLTPEEGEEVVYPLHEHEVLRRFEGYVDLNRVSGGDACMHLVHDFQTSKAVQRLYEFAPRGKSTLIIDGEHEIHFEKAPRALLGRGKTAEVSLTAGSHHIEVMTCRDGEDHGFYLIDRLQRNSGPGAAIMSTRALMDLMLNGRSPDNPDRTTRPEPSGEG